MTKRFFQTLTLVALLFTWTVADASKPKLETVHLWVSVHCLSCKEKIMDNLPYEKGVKDIQVDIEKKTVDVKFDGKKTDAKHIMTAIEKLGYEVKLLQEDAVAMVSADASKGCCSYGSGTPSQCKGKTEGQAHQCCKDKKTGEACAGHKEGDGGKAHSCAGEKKQEGTGHSCSQNKNGATGSGIQTHKCTHQEK